LQRTFVTARLLTPADFGLVGMVLAIVGFVDMFKDLGLATITVQREHLSPEEPQRSFLAHGPRSVPVWRCSPQQPRR